MSLMTRTGERTGASKTRSGSPLKVPEGARILIVCDNNSDTDRLKDVLREAGFVSEWARSITEGCKAAKSGRFQVVVSTPVLSDGSWRRLIDIANHYDLGFEVVLWTRNFDLLDRAEGNEGQYGYFRSCWKRSSVSQPENRKFEEWLAP